MLNLSRNNDGYKGILYGSFIKTDKGIKVIEYNARFGDSECLNIIYNLETPLEAIFNSIVESSLDKLDIKYNNQYCICKYVVPNGYPINKNKNSNIYFNLSETVINENIVMGGLNYIDKNIYKTTGSRICCVISKHDDIKICKKEIDNIVKNIQGDIVFRKDIGNLDNLKNIFTNNNINNSKVNKYAESGVNIEEGEKVVKSIKKIF